jgi:hypothetical protein
MSIDSLRPASRVSGDPNTRALADVVGLGDAGFSDRIATRWGVGRGASGGRVWFELEFGR